MNADDFDLIMRAGEHFHSLRVPPDLYIVIRVDGRSFSALTERRAKKPFDTNFHQHMLLTANALLETLQAAYVYTESDEISCLLPLQSVLFDREVEKLVSLSAARASGTMSILLGEAVEFDSRLWIGNDIQTTIDYFRWRQADASRCALNSWCYWTMRHGGRSASQAANMLNKTGKDEKIALLLSLGIDIEKVPAWQRWGSGLYWHAYEKDGFNPKTRIRVKSQRWRVMVDEELPSKDAYNAYVKERIQ